MTDPGRRWQRARVACDADEFGSVEAWDARGDRVAVSDGMRRRLEDRGFSVVSPCRATRTLTWRDGKDGGHARRRGAHAARSSYGCADAVPTEDAGPLAAHLTREGSVRIEVVARPRSRQSRVAGVRRGALVMDLAAPPVDGAANEELVRTLASALGLPRRAIAIVRGETARSKLVDIRGLSEREVRDRLHAASC